MSDSTDILFSQYAQDPLEGFTQEFGNCCPNPNKSRPKEKKPRQKKENTRKPIRLSTKSFVITKEQKGMK